jgi:serine/threonine protein kinase/Tol biopolymer transport system component
MAEGPMSPERWQQIERIYNDARSRAPGKRSEFLVEACCGDDALRREIESLLDEERRSAGFMERPALEVAARSMARYRPESLVGRQLNHYRIASFIGAGGMAEVYQARDTKLNRDVAIKVLPDAFARDRERLARFHREAQLLASLNHPRIASIYGLEESDGVCGLALELVDGETIADRIARGSVPVAEALDTAQQIAEAVEAAHAKGIVHRDLKPSNIKITRNGTVKVLDFGLAKIFASDPAVADVPTQPAISTEEHVVLGTVAYMSPEQARGKDVDKRTDIWAWGCVLYEMLTGHRAFEGQTSTAVIAKIVAEEPDWTRLPESTPVSIRTALRRAMQKDPNHRLQDIGDARIEMEEVGLTSSPSAVPTTPRQIVWKRFLPWALAPLLAGFAWILKPSGVAPNYATTRFEISLPDGQRLAHSYRHGAVFSLDGKRMAFVTASRDLNVIGNPQSKIYVREMDQADAVPVPGTEGAYSPFFSPDGHWLGFERVGPSGSVQINKVSLAGGAPIVLTEKGIVSQVAGLGGAVAFGSGISWGKNATIVFSDTFGGLKVIPEAGGVAQEFTGVDDATTQSHRLPHFLPDGSGVLFTVFRYYGGNPDWKRAQIWVKSLRNGERKLVIEDGLDAQYADGYLVFARQGKLFAVPFDVRDLSVRGEPVRVLDGVTHSIYGDFVTNKTGAAQFSISENGSLLYAPGGIEPPVLHSLMWVDRKGSMTPVGTKPMSHLSARVSPDGKKVLFNEYYVEADIWLYDTLRGTVTRETFEGQNAYPLWSPDGATITFRSDRSGPLAIYQRELNSPEVIQLTQGPSHTPASWTPDGRELLFTATAPNNPGIYVYSKDEKKVKALIDTPFTEVAPDISVDGKWLAYCSNESKIMEVYVQPYPGPGKRMQISSGGGFEPAWSKDGKELFYLTDLRSGYYRKMMAVRFAVMDGEFRAEKPVFLFDVRLREGNNTRQYDVTLDGRFLMRQELTDNTEKNLNKIFPSSLRVVLNWTSELHRSLSKK